MGTRVLSDGQAVTAILLEMNGHDKPFSTLDVCNLLRAKGQNVMIGTAFRALLCLERLGNVKQVEGAKRWLIVNAKGRLSDGE